MIKKMNGFTEKKFKFTDIKGSSNGQGIDFSKDFKIINSQRLTANLIRGINIKHYTMGYLKYTLHLPYFLLCTLFMRLSNGTIRRLRLG
jgi:hypothetical protein